MQLWVRVEDTKGVEQAPYPTERAELMVLRSNVTNTAYSPTSVNVNVENRAPLSSEVDKETLLRDFGSCRESLQVRIVSEVNLFKA